MLHSRKSPESQRLPVVRGNNDEYHNVLPKSKRMVTVERCKINAALILIIVLFTSNCLLFSMSDGDCWTVV